MAKSAESLVLDPETIEVLKARGFSTDEIAALAAAGAVAELPL